MSRLSINEWAEEDRPREKLQALGAECLSNAELLAILIGSGSTDESAVALMKRIMNDCSNNLNTLGAYSIQGHGTSQSHHHTGSLRIGQTQTEDTG